MVYHFRIHPEGQGFWAECLELEGCVTQADSRQSLPGNMKEALNLYLDENHDSPVIFPEPREFPASEEIVAVPVDYGIAFSMCIRQLRRKHGLTQREAADRLGLKSIFSYQRLESSKNSNPRLSSIARIKSVFPEFSLDRIL